MFKGNVEFWILYLFNDGEGKKIILLINLMKKKKWYEKKIEKIVCDYQS